MMTMTITMTMTMIATMPMMNMMMVMTTITTMMTMPPPPPPIIMSKLEVSDGGYAVGACTQAIYECPKRPHVLFAQLDTLTSDV